MKPSGVDPEYQRYRRAYPKFPGVKTCLDLLRRRNVSGAYKDGVLEDLSEHIATAGPAELSAAFRSEPDDQVRVMVLALIAEKPSAEDLGVFVETLSGGDENLRLWAARGLHRLASRGGEPTPPWRGGVGRVKG